jgi:hypothetical protein
MGTVINAVMTIFLHLAPNIAGAGFSIYQHGLHVDYSRSLQQGHSSHKAVKRGQHTLSGPIHAAIAQ